VYSSLEVVLHHLVAGSLVRIHVVFHHIHKCVLVEGFVPADLIDLWGSECREYRVEVDVRVGIQVALMMCR
jgi:hypothetical protein